MLMINPTHGMSLQDKFSSLINSKKDNPSSSIQSDIPMLEQIIKEKSEGQKDGDVTNVSALLTSKDNLLQDR